MKATSLFLKYENICFDPPYMYEWIGEGLHWMEIQF